MSRRPDTDPATPVVGADALHDLQSYMAILDAIPSHAAVLDGTGVILVVNEAWRRYGTANMLENESFLVGQNYLAVCECATGESSDEAAAVATGIRAVLDGRLSEFTLEYPCHSPTEERWFRLLVAPLAEGDYHGAVVMHVDITARKRAELQAIRLASIVEFSDDAIISKTPDGVVTSWNRAAERIFGYSAEEMIGTSIMRLIPANRHEEETAILDQVRRGTSMEHFETVRVRKDGQPIDVSVTVSPMRDGGGTVIGASKVARDISAQKKLERQFLRAQRLESIGTLAGGIAHDLNNVLSPIMLSVELLRMSDADPPSRELLDAIDRSALHGADLVRQVLSFARGVEGDRLAVRVNQLVRDVERTARDTFLKHIDIHASAPGDLWHVVGDPTQLQQVLLNLCVNARDAMPEGGRLSLSAENVTLDAHDAGLHLDAHAGPYVLVRVEDTGTGITAADLDRIFDPFFTTKDVGKGTGLGLSTSLTIVKSHGGFIRVYSEPGTGTRFNVYLPAAVGVAEEEHARAVALPRGKGELVLVVDDEPAIRQITQRTLETFGYRVVVASDGAEAVALYARRGEEIAVVLTDMMMPVMDGAATTRVLRKLNPAVRIVAASGLVHHGHGTSVGLGIRHFLPKPYTADALLTVLRSCLDETP